MRLREVLRVWQPDVVHVRMFLTQLSPLILPLLEDVPALYHVVWHRPVCPLGTKVLPDGERCHEPIGIACFREGCLPPWDWAALMFQMRLFSRWRGAFDAVVANSHAMKQMLEECGAGPAEVIWNGVPPGPEPAPLLQDPLAVFAGRLVKEKGADVLLRAFSRVPRGQLLIAGDGPERKSLQGLAKELGVEGRVIFEGQLKPDELNRRFQGAWVQVVPSRWVEPFGMVAPEAMMRGTAVIGSDIGGLSEVIEHEQTGMLVPPGGVEPLAEALNCLLGDRQSAVRMGAAGRKRAQLCFSESRWVERFVELYERLIREKGNLSKP